MTTQAEAAASAVPVQLGGKTYLLRPLNIKQEGELTHYLQSLVMQAAVSGLQYVSDEDERDRLYAKAAAHAAGVTWMTEEGQRLLSSIEGASYFIWVAMREDQPEMTLEAVDALIRKEGAMQSVNTALSIQQGTSKKNSTERVARNKARKRRRAEKKKRRR